MKFGFDIDDTLIGLREHAFNLYQKKLGHSVSMDVFNALDRVEIHTAFGLTDQEGKEMWNSSLEEIYYTDCPPYPGTTEALQQLDSEGHEIYYITARAAEHGEHTKEWMKQQGFPVRDGHFFCGMKDADKVETISKLQLDYYVDDKPEVLETLAGSMVHVLVKDQSYNRHLDMPRIKQWAELKDLIQNHKI
jgi:uncharacterized protein